MISVVILAKNEEKNIAECLKTVSWCDEKIVIDDNSTDKTREIAKSLGAKIVETKNFLSDKTAENFSNKRNLGLQKAQGDWILFIDADERVSSPLWYEIMERINDPIGNINGFFCKRIDYLWGKELKHGETANIKLLRLAKKETGKWEGMVHEKWKVSGKTELLKNPILHYPHQTIKEFLQEVNHYTDLRAQELYKKKTSVNWFSIIFYPKAKFIQNFFFKLGFLDGIPGLLSALIMSLHSFLVRGKLWSLSQNSLSSKKEYKS